MDGFEVLKYLSGEPRFHAMATIALLDARDGMLVHLKARLAGARQVVRKPLVRQRIVDLLSTYQGQRISRNIPLRERWASAPPRSAGSQRSFCSRGPASKQSFPHNAREQVVNSRDAVLSNIWYAF